MAHSLNLDELRGRVAARRALAAQIAEPGWPVRFTKPDARSALAQADMSEPGMFRLTRFDAAGPIGHTQYRTLNEAIYDALQEGYEPDAPHD